MAAEQRVAFLVEHPGRHAASPRPRHPPSPPPRAAGSRMRLPASNATASTFGSGSGASSGHVTMVLNPASDNPAPVSAAPVRSSATTTTAIGSAASSRIGTIYILAVRSAPITGEPRPPSSINTVGSNQFATTDESLFDIATHVPGPAGSLPLTPEMLREPAVRRPLRLDAERRHGLERRRRSAAREFLILSHARRRPRARRHADRARLPHRPLGSRPARGGRGAASSRRRARFRSPAPCTDPCDGRTQGTPACSTACRTATTRRWSSAG